MDVEARAAHSPPRPNDKVIVRSQRRVRRNHCDRDVLSLRRLAVAIVRTVYLNRTTDRGIAGRAHVENICARDSEYLTGTVALNNGRLGTGDRDVGADRRAVQRVADCQIDRQMCDTREMLGEAHRSHGVAAGDQDEARQNESAHSIRAVVKYRCRRPRLR